MVFRYTLHAALIASAAFVFSVCATAQAPIIDASVDTARSGGSATPAPATPQQKNTATGVDQGELFYQLQLLQQEVMQLRGQVEEQGYMLQQLKEQNMERYIDLDRRLGNVTSGAAEAAPAANKAAPVTGMTVEAVARAGEKEAYDHAYSLVISKQFDAAQKAFQQFLVDFPDGKYAPNSYYWLGELYQVVNPANLNGAREVLTQLLNQYPDHPKVPDAMYKLGKVYYLMGNKSAAREWLEKVIAQYSTGSNSSAADKARQFLNANF